MNENYFLVLELIKNYFLVMDILSPNEGKNTKLNVEEAVHNCTFRMEKELLEHADSLHFDIIILNYLQPYLNPLLDHLLPNRLSHARFNV